MTTSGAGLGVGGEEEERLPTAASTPTNKEPGPSGGPPSRTWSGREIRWRTTSKETRSIKRWDEEVECRKMFEDLIIRLHSYCLTRWVQLCWRKVCLAEASVWNRPGDLSTTSEEWEKQLSSKQSFCHPNIDKFSSHPLLLTVWLKRITFFMSPGFSFVYRRQIIIFFTI